MLFRVNTCLWARGSRRPFISSRLKQPWNTVYPRWSWWETCWFSITWYWNQSSISIRCKRIQLNSSQQFCVFSNVLQAVNAASPRSHEQTRLEIKQGRDVKEGMGEGALIWALTSPWMGCSRADGSRGGLCGLCILWQQIISFYASWLPPYEARRDFLPLRTASLHFSITKEEKNHGDINLSPAEAKSSWCIFSQKKKEVGPW